ncbi:peptidylprolyl isomerase [Metabacillus niabensis]|uniref:Peptidyl-prolyl cis-trans isomerase n=1 Tax=Metabacillus niabensis TaxID=324854 RepID=A0ABT9Z727_9BACI|nr:peptidylprolyl isomerase [Metabacillus niabensis]MDQ0227418.1 peptidyl-prolyl cis-trans isomerase B (cyclophilin B) [Metabacillus niabensis]
MKQFSKVSLALLVGFILFLVAGCGTSITEDKTTSSSTQKKEEQVIEKNPVATITMENNKIIKVELYPAIAPNTVNNFISLANSGFYNGLTFHRVVPDFMIQGGDPNGDGTGGPDYQIKGEFSSNGYENNLKHERGVISIARSEAPDSAGSQFFIMVADAPHLDGEYAGFGKVIEGMDVVDEIVSVERDGEKPLKEQKIKDIIVDTFGIVYPEPKKIE